MSARAVGQNEVQSKSVRGKLALVMMAIGVMLAMYAMESHQASFVAPEKLRKEALASSCVGQMVERALGSPNPITNAHLDEMIFECSAMQKESVQQGERREALARQRSVMDKDLGK